MTRRITPTIATVACGCLLLAACSTEQEPGGTSTEITMWMYPVVRDPEASEAYWGQVEEEFDAGHDGIDLTIELQPFDTRDTQISAALAAGTGPDIVMITPDQASTYYAADGLLPVGEALVDDEQNFFPAALDVATFDGSLYGAPLFQNASTVSYNTSVFEDAGLDLPQTWDDVLAAAPVLAENGIAVMDYAGDPEVTLNVTFYPFLWQAGGSIFTEDGSDIAFDSPEGVEALQFLLDLQAAGGLPTDVDIKNNRVEGSPLAQGVVGMRVMTSMSELAQMRDSLGEGDVQLGLPLTGEEQVTFANPGLLSLTSINDEDSRDAAYEVIRYLTSADVQMTLNEASGTFPTRSDVASSGDDEDRSTMLAALEYANPGEVHPNARQVMAVLAPHVQSALQGRATASEALSAAATEAREILERT